MPGTFLCIRNWSSQRTWLFNRLAHTWTQVGCQSRNLQWWIRSQNSSRHLRYKRKISIWTSGFLWTSLASTWRFHIESSIGRSWSFHYSFCKHSWSLWTIPSLDLRICYLCGSSFCLNPYCSHWLYKGKIIQKFKWSCRRKKACNIEQRWNNSGPPSGFRISWRCGWYSNRNGSSSWWNFTSSFWYNLWWKCNDWLSWSNQQKSAQRLYCQTRRNIKRRTKKSQRQTLSSQSYSHEWN